MRALGFFYHLSLAVLFTTFTELLLDDFGGNFAKTAAFLGCVCVSPTKPIHIDTIHALQTQTTPTSTQTPPPPPHTHSTCAGMERGVQFFTSPLLGNISDSAGRRPVLLASLALHLASLILVTIIPSRNSVLCYFIVNGACACVRA